MLCASTLFRSPSWLLSVVSESHLKVAEAEFDNPLGVFSESLKCSVLLIRSMSERSFLNSTPYQRRMVRTGHAASLITRCASAQGMWVAARVNSPPLRIPITIASALRRFAKPTMALTGCANSTCIFLIRFRRTESAAASTFCFVSFLILFRSVRDVMSG